MLLSPRNQMRVSLGGVGIPGSFGWGFFSCLSHFIAGDTMGGTWCASLVLVRLVLLLSSVLISPITVCLSERLQAQWPAYCVCLSSECHSGQPSSVLGVGGEGQVMISLHPAAGSRLSTRTLASVGTCFGGHTHLTCY